MMIEVVDFSPSSLGWEKCNTWDWDWHFNVVVVVVVKILKIRYASHLWG